MSKPHQSHDVIIVGAGYAGLAAALSISDAGHDALILEASERPGGRTYSQPHDLAAIVDHGGQWVGPTQTRLLAMADRFRCERFPTHDAGKHIELWPESQRYDAPTGHETSAPGLQGYDDAVRRIEEIASRIDREHPAQTPGAAELDSTTVATWIQDLQPESAARIRLAVQGVWAVEPRDLSMLHLAFYVASAGGWDQLMQTLDHAQDARFRDGAQAPAIAAADHLFGRIRYSQGVRTVSCTPSGFTITTHDTTYQAQRVIVACPPPAIRSIDFKPALPYVRRRWIERSVMGDVAKIHVIYDEPFWRDAGFSGQASLYTSDHIGVVFDNSPPTASSGVLVGFIYGDRLRDWATLDTASRKRSVLKTLETLHGHRASQPLDYLEKNWTHDTWAGGAYAAVPAPGAWVEYGTTGWRTPIGGLHWAGTETADQWHGYIDGAIRSGERAAAHVLQEIGTQPPS